MNIFSGNGSEQNKTPEKSMVELFREGKAMAKEQVKKEITKALIESDTQKELYRTSAMRAIVKARKAIDRHNQGEKAIAYNELKFAYGLYHYMDSLHTAFRTMESQLQIQEMTQEFANVVTSLKSIRLPSSKVDFNSITATALKSMGSFDTAGLDSMVKKLIEGSLVATNASHANDAFLDDLVSGKTTLEAPYMEEQPEIKEKEQEKEVKNAESEGTDELLALLEQINAGLNQK